MRILIFNWRDWQHPHAGGAEIYTHHIAEEWVKAGHEVTLFCAAVPGLPDLDIAGGVKVIRRGNRYSVYREAKRYYRRNGRGSFDLVIDEINTVPFGCPRFVDDVPVLALVHQVSREVWFHETPFPASVAGRYVLEPWWLRAYRDVPVVTVSNSSRESLRAYGIDHAVVVPEGNSLPDLEISVQKEERPTVVFCGRLSSNKRPDHALEAFKLLLQRMPEARLWMVGSGTMAKRLHRTAPASGVTFFGRVGHEQKFSAMARAHALVATSVREGWGLVVSEAASVGTTSVGYDVAGLRDSVTASNGVLVAPKPAALAEKLADVIPRVMNGTYPTPRPGGLAPWAEVASSILAAAGKTSVASQDFVKASGTT